MPIIYEFNEMKNLVFVTASGELTEEELLRFWRFFINDSLIRPGFRALFDATALRCTITK